MTGLINMQKIKIYHYIIIFILSFGCASNNDHKFVDQVSEDLVNSFDLNDKQFDKFKVSEINEKKKKQSVKESNKNQKNKDIKQVKIKKNDKKIVKNKITKKVNDKSKDKDITPKKKRLGPTQSIKVVEKVEEEVFPDEYPKIYRKYDKQSENHWNVFSPNVYINEELIMEISFLGITVGAVRLKTHEMVEMGTSRAFHFSAALKSANYYSMIYKLDDTLSSYVENENFLPMKYTLTQRESGQAVDDLQLFDHEKYQTFFWFKRDKKGILKKQEKSGFTPGYFQDIFSSLYFVRGLPLKLGAEYVFPIVTRAKIWMMTMKVEKKETIKIMGKWTKAIKLAAYTQVPGEKKKNGVINFWYSDDEKRLLLDFKAKVKIGNVEGKLIEYKPGKAYHK